jgi:2,5-diamino-6-(ribosylamino)-4(3H)-pyrimidinone 5'-phosphate reductase
MDHLSPDLALFYELASIWQEDATLVGANTLLQGLAEESNAEEAVGTGEPSDGLSEQRPLLAVPDSRGRVRDWDRVRRWPYWRDVVALCSRSTPRDYLDYLAQSRVEYIVAGDDHVDLRAALEQLGDRHAVKLVRVDSGGTLNGALLRAGLVEEVSVLILPCLVGGASPTHTIFRAPDLEDARGVLNLRLIHVEKVRGDAVWLRYEVLR